METEDLDAAWEANPYYQASLRGESFEPSPTWTPSSPPPPWSTG
jgi:hypothetical protein